jgi:hypothetical protein
MSLQRALTTIANDPAANAKIKLGVMALAVPWVGIAAVGYQVALARRVAAGVERDLPEWDDPGALFRSGLGLAVARLCYELPSRLLTLAVLLLALRPFWKAAAAAQPLWPAPAGQALGTLAAGAAAILVYNLAYGFLSPAITAQYVQHGTLRACFAFPAMLRLIVRRRRAYLRVWLLRELTGLALRLVGLGAGALLAFLPVVGSLAGTFSWSWLLFVSLLLNGCLVGQLLQLDPDRALYPPAPGAALAAPTHEA